MENTSRRKIAIAGYVIFCIYVIFMWSISGLINWPKSDMWLCIIGIIAGGFLTFSKKFKAEPQAYLLGFCSTVTIFNFSEYTNQFTEIFLVLCALTCVLSFYHVPSINYVHLGSTTIFVVYNLLMKGWLLHIIQEKDYIIIVRIACIYLVEITMLLMVKWHLKALKTAEEKTRLAERAGQAKADFLANVSHEIRTPLNVINGMTELVMQKNLDEEVKEYVYGIHHAGDNLLTVINDILDFSKIESGELELTDEVYETMSLFYDICSIAKMQLAEKEPELVVDINPAFPMSLRGDVVRLKQVIMNLMSNAIKYTEHGEICFKADFVETEKGIDLTISVRDSGIGIKEEDAKQLFQAFKQIDSKRSRAYNGTGLGLAITKRIVSLMGGELRLESKYGEGSHFYFTIPQIVVNGAPGMDVKDKEKICIGVYAENEAVRNILLKTVTQLGLTYREITDRQSIIAGQTGGISHLFIDCEKTSDVLEILRQISAETTVLLLEDSCLPEYEKFAVETIKKPVCSMTFAVALNREKLGRELYEQEISAGNRRFYAPDVKILIVDDNAVNLKVAEGLLRPYGMQIDKALSGEESIQKIMDTHYDLVLMDHMMPKMDGIEATKIIRQKEDSYFKNLPIIALTANAVHGAQKMFKEAGMNDFVSKPIEMRRLSDKLKKWLPKEKIIPIHEIQEEKKTPLQNEGRETTRISPSKDDLTEETKIEAVFGNIQGLNVANGLDYVAGDEALYHDVLTDYADEVEKRSADILKFLSEGDLENYTIQVHALKSVSKTIGAMELSELAKELEDSGRTKNMQVICEKTPVLLRQYRELGENLKQCEEWLNGGKASTTEELEEKVSIKADSEQLTQILRRLTGCLEEYDSFGAEEILEEMKQYRYKHKEQKELFYSMLQAMKEFDYDSCKEAVEQMLLHLHTE